MSKTYPPLPDELGPLNPEQGAAVTHVDGPLLILAGAGSGKTRVLTHRIAYMVHAGIDPMNILAVTFTNKAAHEMKERVSQLTGPRGAKLWVSTFHASCCRILRIDAEHLGYTRRFAIYDDDDQLRLLRQILVDQGQDPKMNPPSAILSKIDHYKNRMDTVDELLRDHRLRPTDPLAKLWRAYEEALRASDAMDFNDLINKVVELFEHHPEVLDKWVDRFHYVMVDEYQDTNAAQYKLLKLLTAKRRNLAVVGDDDQSIYGFRGADIRNILDFKQDFPEATTVRMERNYRCTERILELANAVVAKNGDRIVKRLFTEDKKGGSRVTFRNFEEPREEARGVAIAIRQLHDRGTPWGDIAVIYRTNATSLPFELAFRDAAVPHKVVGGRPFYSRREIRDAVSYVRLVANPADDAAFLRIVNVPPRGIGTTTLTKLRAVATERGEPLLKAARSMAMGQDRVGKALAGFVKMIDQMADAAQVERPAPLIHRVLESTGYLEMLRDDGDAEAQARVDNLNQLLRFATDFEPEEVAGTPIELLHAWLDKATLVGNDEEIPEGGVVTMMTVHNAKGLEYPVVFVVHVVEGQFPHSRAEAEGGVEEERRLAYVAFTRAKDRLVITRHKRSPRFDPRNPNAPGSEPVAASRFLYGIPLEACDGDVPELEAKTEEAAQLARVTRTVEEDKLSAFVTLRRRAAAPPRQDDEGEPAPVDTYRTRPVESAEDLAVGVRVLCEGIGTGTIRQVSPPRVWIAFKGRTEWIQMADHRLQILSE